MRFTLSEAAAAVKGSAPSGAPGTMCSGVSIDTRTLKAGDLFVAIRGAHFDGHAFLEKAAEAGASAFIVGRGAAVPPGAAAIEVDDTERALGDLAAWWRSRFSMPRVAITGSNGKSTTKEMTASIAEALGPVLKTEGNFNNLIGLPLTVFRMDDAHRVAILEMGMNAPGEIARLTGIADPTVGIITNVTAAHLERLHDVDTVARAKGELFETMREDAVAVVNGEDRRVRELGRCRKSRTIIFGMQNDFDVRFLHMETTGLESMDLKIAVMGREYEAKLPVPGAHNVMNALAAVSVGVALGVDAGEAVERLSRFRPMSMRMERVQLANGARVVNDSYNANPESMKAAFRTVGSARRAGRFVAALGDMLELGAASAELHRQVGEAAAQMGVGRLYVVGEFARELAAGAKGGGLKDSEIIICDGVESVSSLVESELKAGDVLLVKGSRGMRMERIVERLKSSIGTD